VRKQTPRPNPAIRLTDESLFGNDAADLEHDALFYSYAVERPELEDFLDPSKSIQIARAYKGEGKSGLLRITTNKLRASEADQLIVNAIGPDHSPTVSDIDSDLWTREWKKSLLKLVANEIGATLGTAFTDDAITLVEEAEANGFKKRSFISAITDRLRIKDLPIDRTRVGAADYEKLVSRYLDGRPLIWLVIDDVDQNFANTERWRVKLGAFFTACRQIVSVIPELRIRTAIRPNVWAIVKREFESLSHLEQYVKDMSWTQEQFRWLLSERVKSYLTRTNQWNIVAPSLPREAFLREQALVGLIFDDPMPWGGGDRKRPPHTVLWTLTGHRPRWLIELCKVAATAASARRASRIGLDDISAQLGTFGKKRIEDTVAEFKAQCPEIEDLLGAFSRQKDLYSTDELLTTIRNRIFQAVSPKLHGVMGKPSETDVAHFLFQIGFIAGRRDFGPHRGYDHVMYRDNPSLLRTKTNMDDGLRWEINPIYREVLNLRTVTDKQNAKSGGR
jgi:hypothetical protein